MNKLKFRHKAIYGMTDMGKSWFLKRMAKILLRYKQKVIVYTASGDIDFPKGCLITPCVEELESWLSMAVNQRAHVMLDEASVLFRLTKPSTHPKISNICSMGRHDGHTAWLATQRPTLIPPNLRENCGECYCFRLGGKKSAQLVFDDYNELDFEGRPAWEVIKNLPPLQALHFIQPQFIEKISLI